MLQIQALWLRSQWFWLSRSREGPEFAGDADTDGPRVTEKSSIFSIFSTWSVKLTQSLTEVLKRSRPPLFFEVSSIFFQNEGMSKQIINTIKFWMLRENSAQERPVLGEVSRIHCLPLSLSSSLFSLHLLGWPPFMPTCRKVSTISSLHLCGS